MLGVVKITVTDRTAASPEDVIDVLRDWRRLPEFWRGIREISQTSGQMFLVRFAFPGHAKMSYICDRKLQSCVENYHSGPFSGFKRLELQKDDQGTIMTVRWEIRLSPMMILMRRFLVRHFTEGTQSALKRISSEAEMEMQVAQPISVR